MKQKRKTSTFLLGFSCLALSACGGSDSSGPNPQPVSPAPSPSPTSSPTPAPAVFSVDIMNTSTGFVLATSATGQVNLNGYESEITIIVHAPSEFAQMVFVLSSQSGNHCPAIDATDTGSPFEFTLQTPSAGGVCDYELKGTGSSNTTIETISINFSGGGTPPGSGGSPGQRYNLTFGTNMSAPYSIGPTGSRDAHGNRIYCVISHFSYDDPIIYPDEPGRAHLHMFWGNTATDAFTTSESILQTGLGSCEGGMDYRVGAWIPAVFNSQDEVVVPQELFIYYKTFGGPQMRYDLVQEIPQGLQMLASADTMGFDPSLIRAGFGPHEGERALSFDISFPSCVATQNGQRTGVPILSYRDMPGEAANRVNSHVAYPSGGNEVDCPASHPYRFATPQFIMFFEDSATGDSPYLSSDAMAGAPALSTLHGDYMFGSSPAVNQSILRCVQESRSCEFSGGRGQLPDRFRGPSGQVYLSSVEFANGVDRTPFGNSLPPVLGADTSASGADRYHHGH